MPNFYLVPWIGDGSDGNEFRPRVEAGAWSAIDLRADVTSVEGWALVASDTPVTTPTGGLTLGNDADATVRVQSRGAIESRLGVTIGATSLRALIAELLILHGESDLPRRTRWKRLMANHLGQHRIVMLGQVLYEAPAVEGAIITDNFNRANQSGLGTSPEGWSWDSQFMNIASNRTSNSTSSEVAFARPQVVLGSDNHYIQFNYQSTINTTDTHAWVRMYAGPLSDPKTGYRYFIEHDGTLERINRFVDGNATVIGTNTGYNPNGSAPGDLWRFEANGSTIEMFANGASRIAVTDTVITGNPRVGISGNGNGADRSRVDNFRAGEIRAVPTVRTATGDITTNTANQATSISVNKPANLANGDYVTINVSLTTDSGSATSFVPPSGFVGEIEHDGVSAGTNMLYRARKVITNAAGEPASWTISWTNTVRAGAICLAIQGADDAFPVNIKSKTIGPNDGTAPLAGVTTTDDYCLLLLLYTSFRVNATFTNPGTDLANISIGGSGNKVSMEMARDSQLIGGATGAKDATQDTTTGQTANFIVALQPPPFPTPFPRVKGRTTSDVSVPVTSHSVALPNGIQTGELLVVLFGLDFLDPVETISWPSGWTVIASGLGDPNGRSRSQLAYRQVTGTEGFSGAGDTITVTTSAVDESAHASVRISDAEDVSIQAPEAAATAAGGGTSTSPDAPLLTPTGGAKDYLWLWFWNTRNNAEITAYPASYSNGQQRFAPGTSNLANAGSAERQLNAASENPAAATQDQARPWMAYTVAIHPAGGQPPGGFGPPENIILVRNPTQVDLSWDAVTGADAYDVERDSVVLARTAATSYEDSGLTPGTRYEYRVRAVRWS